MRILHLSTYDGGGGAARAANRLHTGLLRQGHDSHMLVMNRNAGSDHCSEVKRHNDLPTRFKRRKRRQKITRDFARYKPTLPAGHEWFSDDRSELAFDMGRSLAKLLPVDIINLHWVGGLLDYTQFFGQLPLDVPIVWRLADMAPTTGGCHYDENCGKFTARCGACPVLGSTVENDLSRQVWQRKHDALGNILSERLTIVGTSRWIAATAQRSSLLGRFPRHVIPNGLDADVFSPRDKKAARNVLGLPAEARIVLFVADSSRIVRKGFAQLATALASLHDVPNLHLVSVGGAQASVPGVPHTHLGRITMDRVLSMVYSAADVFVIPSLQESFGQTATESMACGTPVVGFNAGGIPDMVRPGITGYLAPVGDSAALAAEIRRVFGDPAKWQELSTNCRRIAVDEYTFQRQADAYAALYQSILQR